MRHVRTLAVCVFAALALGVIGASAAQAETLEWGYCQETPAGWGGKYSNSSCTQTVKSRSGEYEWFGLGPERKKHLEPTTVEGEITFETAAGAKIQCAGLGGENEQVPFSKHGALTPLMQFGGCGSGGLPCGQFAAHTEFIGNTSAYAAETWRGTLGFVSGKGTESPVVGIQYTAKNKEELLFEPIVCEGPLGTVKIGAAKGKPLSLIATIGPVNTMTNEFTTVYSESAPGVSSPAGFEGKKPGHLEIEVHQHWEPVALTAVFHQGYESNPSERFEIKATK